MQNENRIDFTKLLGFDAVAEELACGIDFRNETIAARLGAKVGDKLATLDVPLKDKASKVSS